MFAFIGSNITTIVDSINELNLLIATNQYPKFKKFKDREKALSWLRANSRGFHSDKIIKYGDTSYSGYVQIVYFIDEDERSIFYNIDTTEFGDLYIRKSNDYIQDRRLGNIKVKVLNTVLNNSLIAHHCIAIRRILNILGEYIDVDIVVPDMSIYYAITSYKGNVTNIRVLQELLRTRLGSYSLTVNNKYNI